MKTLISGGGLGDAAMIFAAIQSKACPINLFEPYYLTHVELPRKLLSLISGFYRYQNIRAEVFHINSWDWLSKNRSDYDCFVSTHWDGKNDFEDGWRINSFPDIVSNHIEGIDTIVSPSAGRNGNRKFREEDISKVILRDSVKVISPDNTPTIRDLIDVICSANIVIGHAGFVTFFAGMAGKKVFMVPEKPASDMRVDPLWDVTEIGNLMDVC